MPLTLDTPLQLNPDVIATELTDRHGAPEAVLLNIATQQYFSLNATGTCIWKALERRQLLSAAVAELTAAFDVSPERAEASVLRLAETLVEAGLITEVSAPVQAVPHQSSQP